MSDLGLSRRVGSVVVFSCSTILKMDRMDNWTTRQGQAGREMKEPLMAILKYRIAITYMTRSMSIEYQVSPNPSKLNT